MGTSVTRTPRWRITVGLVGVAVALDIKALYQTRYIPLIDTVPNLWETPFDEFLLLSGCEHHSHALIRNS